MFRTKNVVNFTINHLFEFHMWLKRLLPMSAALCVVFLWLRFKLLTYWSQSGQNFKILWWHIVIWVPLHVIQSNLIQSALYLCIHLPSYLFYTSLLQRFSQHTSYMCWLGDQILITNQCIKHQLSWIQRGTSNPLPAGGASSLLS